MATNSLGGNKIATTDGPPAESGTPPPVSAELKEEVKNAEAGEVTGKRAPGHDESDNTKSVGTAQQVESTIRKAADVGGVGGGK